MSEPMNFLVMAEEFQEAKLRFEDALVNVGLGEFEEMGWDSYDASLELYDVSVARKPLTPDQQKVIRDYGFSKVYANYIDGTAEVYHWKWPEPKPVKGHPVEHKTFKGVPFQ